MEGNKKKENKKNEMLNKIISQLLFLSFLLENNNKRYRFRNTAKNYNNPDSLLRFTVFK